MAQITTKQTKNIVRTNRIMVDNQHIKTQQYTIDSENPTSLNPTSFFVGTEGEAIYKANRTAIRTVEDTFEDEVFVEQDELIASLGGNASETK